MLNIGFGELLVVLLIAYVIVGPRDLPRIARWLGRQVRRIRRMNREFREVSGWNDLVSGSEDVRREVEEVVRDADISGVMEEASRGLNEEETIGSMNRKS